MNLSRGADSKTFSDFICGPHSGAGGGGNAANKLVEEEEEEED